MQNTIAQEQIKLDLGDQFDKVATLWKVYDFLERNDSVFLLSLKAEYAITHEDAMKLLGVVKLYQKYFC